MKPIFRSVLGGGIAIALSCCAAYAETLSSNGWEGGYEPSPDGTPQCYLDSPVSASSLSGRARVYVSDPFKIVIAFLPLTPPAGQPRGRELAVRLSLSNQDPTKDDWTSDDPYLIISPQENNIPWMLIFSSRDDRIWGRFAKAKFLKVHFTDPQLGHNGGLNWGPSMLLDLVHKGSSPQSNFANDTVGAIADVEDCIERKGFASGVPGAPKTLKLDETNRAAMQAKTNYELATTALLLEMGGETGAQSYHRLLDVAHFYCSAKSFIKYSEQASYPDNVTLAGEQAEAKLRELSFWGDDESPDIVLLQSTAIQQSDRFLCPGWPGHDRP
jgi:hypothetical protein